MCSQVAAFFPKTHVVESGAGQPIQREPFQPRTEIYQQQSTQGKSGYGKADEDQHTAHAVKPTPMFQGLEHTQRNTHGVGNTGRQQAQIKGDRQTAHHHASHRFVIFVGYT